jgi:hypothetical protein
MTPMPDRTDEVDLPPLVVCSGCGTAAAPLGRVVPTGWLIARRPEDGRSKYAHGVCPACVSGRYTFPAADPAAHPTPSQIST